MNKHLTTATDISGNSEVKVSVVVGKCYFIHSYQAFASNYWHFLVTLKLWLTKNVTSFRQKLVHIYVQAFAYNWWHFKNVTSCRQMLAHKNDTPVFFIAFLCNNISKMWHFFFKKSHHLVKVAFFAINIRKIWNFWDFLL